MTQDEDKDRQLPHRSQRRGWAAIVSATLVGLCLVPLTALPAAAATATLPPVRHIWVLEIENTEYAALFGNPNNTTTPVPYLTQTLPSEGAVIPYYFGTGHNSLDNYIAEVSGQAPDPETQLDCGDYTPIPATSTDVHGQVVGQGCEYPNTSLASALTLGNQLSAAGLSWKGYMQDMGQNLAGDGATACAHPAAHQTTRGYPNPQSDDGSSNYAVKHNPFGYFDSVIDNDANCRKHVVPLEPDLSRDLSSIATTPNYSLIVPTVTWDGHDSSDAMEAFPRKYVSMIMASPAYRQDGMLVIMPDEGSGFDGSACCNEIPGPNSPTPGEAGTAGSPGSSAGGGQIGAVVLSPYVKPGTVVLPPGTPPPAPSADGTSTGPVCAPTMCTGPGYYNHYSLLRTIEDLFNLGSVPGMPSSDGHGHLGFAGTYADYAGPGEFGCEVFTAYPNCGSALGPRATAASPADPLGPRPLTAGSSSGWSLPGVGANDLRAIACPTSSVCVAVGATGTIVATADGGRSWLPVPSGTATALNGIACPTATSCLAVGNAGALVTLAAGASGWAASVGSLPTGGDMNGISCVSPTNCVAVGDKAIVATTDGGVSWRAPANLALPPLAPGSTPDLLAVSCAATACYAVGSMLNVAPGDTTATSTLPSASNIFKSANPFAGPAATWTAQQYVDAANTSVKSGTSSASGFAARLRAITCIDATHCIATGESAALATTVDGSTWNDQSGIVPQHHSSAGNQTANAQLYNAISCPATTTPLKCVAVGNRPTFGTGANMTLAGYAAIQASALVASIGAPGTATPDTTSASPAYCTGNPTSTCNTAILERPGTFDTLNAVTCPAVDACIAVGDRGTIVRTSAAVPSPASTVWTANLRDSVIAWDPAVGGNVDSPVYGISCATLTDCAAVGGGSSDLAEPAAVFAATGPATWTPTSVPAPPQLAALVGKTAPSPPPTDLGARLAGTSCPAAGQCIAVGSTGWIATLSNGAWTSKHVDPTGQTAIPAQPAGQPTRNVVPTEDLQAVNCAPNSTLAGDTCVAVGDRGAVVISTDGGLTWAVTGGGSTPFTTAGLDGVACPDWGVCIAAGAGGTVLALTNLGGTWTSTPIVTPTTQLLSGVSCPSPTSCVVVGAGGTILTLSRGLAGWSATTSNSGVGDDLYGVSCASTAVCAAAGDHGTVVTTIDGAVTWSALGTGTNVVLRSISCPTITSCFEAGDSGTVLSTQTPVPGSLGATLSLGSAQISTDGGTTTATVTVTNNGAPDAHATVTLSRTGTGGVGTITNHGDGTYAVPLTASPRAGTETITAHAVDGSLAADATTSLTNTVGVPAIVTLIVNPSRIQADGVTSAQATATVTDVHQNAVPGESITFTSDGDVSPSPGSATTDASGVASSTLTATKTVGTQQIFATDTAHNVNTHQPLTLLAPTTAPTNVFASPGDRQAIVGWTAATPADGDTLTDYVVTASPASANGPVTVPASATTTDVPGLTNGTAYTFTVKAEFGSGATTTSSPSGPVTPFGEPSVPNPVTAVAGDATADVRWGASDPNGSPIQGYVVTASPGGAQIAAAPDQTTAHFSGLTNGTSYTFTVTARNADEPVTSPPSAAVVPKFGTAFRVAAAQTAIIGGQTGTVHGTLTRDGVPLAQAKVTIAVRRAGATSYSTLATVTTGGSGQWSLSVSPTRNSSYRISYAGAAANRAASATTSMLVHAQVHLGSPRSGTTMHSGSIVVTATTLYAVAGTKAWLQYLRPNGEWADLGYSTVSSKGTVRLVTSLNRGTRWLRIYLVSTSTNAAASTTPFVLYLT